MEKKNLKIIENSHMWMNNVSSIFLVVSDIATFFLDNALYFLPVTSLDIVLDVDSRYDVDLLVY